VPVDVMSFLHLKDKF